MKYKIFVSFSLPDQFTIEAVNDFQVVFPYYRYAEFLEKCPADFEHFISLPLVVRNKDVQKITRFVHDSKGNPSVKGFIANNTETLMLLKKAGYAGDIISGPGVYVWNSLSAETVAGDLAGFVYPYELSKYELAEIPSEKGILNVYGKTPLMISANCIRNTDDKCAHGTGSSFGTLIDRKNMKLPVFFQCENCYNVIYNAIPNSLHEFIGKETSFSNNLMISFSDEDMGLVNDILAYFAGKTKIFPLKEFTKAYFKHGVE